MQGYNFPVATTPKKISVSGLGVTFWGSPLFLAVLGLCHDRGIGTLNFGPISTKLGGTVRAIKKMTQNDNGPGPSRNYGEMPLIFFTFSHNKQFPTQKIGSLRSSILKLEVRYRINTFTLIDSFKIS